jgi:hypothetical protein
MSTNTNIPASFANFFQGADYITRARLAEAIVAHEASQGASLENWIPPVRVLRALTGAGLKEAKEAVQNAQTLRRSTLAFFSR